MNTSKTLSHTEHSSIAGYDLIVLTFCLNDWDSLGALALDLETEMMGANKRILLMVIDDGSSVKPRPFSNSTFQNLSVEIVCLSRNVGHQRAIAVGLCLISTRCFSSPVVVMDCDGEDKPQDIIRLLESLEAKSATCVFAQRGTRSEGIVFRAGYSCYRLVHRLFTGQNVRFGNFAILQPQLIKNLVLDPNLMNHFSATILSGRYSYESVRCDRGLRYHGKSQMNLERLITHGLSAISCFTDRVATRLLLMFSVSFLISMIGVIAVVLTRWGTNLVIPNWVNTAAFGFAIMASQFAVASLLFTFGVLASRSLYRAFPIDIYERFICRT